MVGVGGASLEDGPYGDGLLQRAPESIGTRRGPLTGGKAKGELSHSWTGSELRTLSVLRRSDGRLSPQIRWR